MKFHLSYVLERRTHCGNLQTIALLMPPLFSFAAVSCQTLEHYEPFRKYPKGRR
ncbi:MAG: hypothetical protein ACLVAW_28195 [Eisenbergiella massiliensis]